MVKLTQTKKEDLRFIFDAELASCRYFDEDFEVEHYRPWMVGFADLEAFLKRRTGVKTLTVTYLVDCEDGTQAPWICGFVGVELTETGYEVVYLIIHPDAPAKELIRAIAHSLKTAVANKRAPANKEVVLHLIDRDEARLREFLPLWRSHGFALSLSPDFFPDHIDGWKLTWVNQAVIKKERTKDKHL